jgi:hypothetical protein
MRFSITAVVVAMMALTTAAFAKLPPPDVHVPRTIPYVVCVETQQALVCVIIELEVP